MKYYETLGVPRDASQEEIRQAYRRKCSEAHPDKGGSVEEMQAVNSAYDTLSDPGVRALYDQTGDGAPARPPEVDAREVLIELFGQAVGAQLTTAEIEAVVRSTLTAMQQRTRSSVPPLQQKQERLERLRKTITTEDGVENIAAVAIQLALDGAADDLALMQHAEKVAAAGLVMLNAHKFAAEPTPPALPMRVHWAYTRT